MFVNFRVASSLIFGVEVEKGVIWVINSEKVVNGNQIHGELQWKAVDLTSYVFTQPLTATSHRAEQCYVYEMFLHALQGQLLAIEGHGVNQT